MDFRGSAATLSLQKCFVDNDAEWHPTWDSLISGWSGPDCILLETQDSSCPKEQTDWCSAEVPCARRSSLHWDSRSSKTPGRGSRVQPVSKEGGRSVCRSVCTSFTLVFPRGTLQACPAQAQAPLCPWLLGTQPIQEQTHLCLLPAYQSVPCFHARPLMCMFYKFNVLFLYQENRLHWFTDNRQ